ncbi:hypothetical protein TCA2_4510 [Paenibacillus sp. TCA20]|nr:hypothetical protein TCA2_4510 [Paenibacillus sp. TCA20]
MDYLQRVSKAKGEPIVVRESDYYERWRLFQECDNGHIAVVAHRRAGKTTAISEKAIKSNKNVVIFDRYVASSQAHRDMIRSRLIQDGIQYDYTSNGFSLGNGRTISLEMKIGEYAPQELNDCLVIFDEADSMMIHSSWLEQVMIYADVIMVSTYTALLDNTFKKFLSNRIKPRIGDHEVLAFIMPSPRAPSSYGELFMDAEQIALQIECDLARARKFNGIRHGRGRRLNASFQTTEETRQVLPSDNVTASDIGNGTASDNG